MLAIAGGKGGCGKTTTTLGLAAALTRGRVPVLAVDADRDMPNLHRLADVPRSPGLADLGEESPDADRNAAPRPADAVAHEVPAHPGVAVVPSSPGTSAPGNVDVAATLARFRDRSGSVLVDCPAGAGRAAADPLRVADRVLLVTTLRPSCLRDAAKTAAMARELGTSVAGAVVTKVPADARARTVERAARALDCPALATVPRVAAASGRAVLADPSVAASYARLAGAFRGAKT